MSRTATVPFDGAFLPHSCACHAPFLAAKLAKLRLLSSPGLPELTEEEIALARQQDRLDYAACKARGVWRNAGLPACPPLGGWTRPKTQRLESSLFGSVFSALF